VETNLILSCSEEWCSSSLLDLPLGREGVSIADPPWVVLPEIGPIFAFLGLPETIFSTFNKKNKS
jgi:hypothetical protein